MLMSIIGWIVWGLVVVFVARRFVIEGGEGEFAEKVLFALDDHVGGHAETSPARRRGA